MWDRLKEQLKQLGIEKELEAEFRTGMALEAARAEREQAQLARFNHNNPRRGVEGMGQTKYSMNPFYSALATVRFGRGWQKDPATVRKMLQENPEFRVPYAATSMVAVDGFKPPAQQQTAGIQSQ